MVVGFVLVELNASQLFFALKVMLVVVLSSWFVDLCSSKLPTGCSVTNTTMKTKVIKTIPNAILVWSRKRNIFVPVDTNVPI